MREKEALLWGRYSGDVVKSYNVRSLKRGLWGKKKTMKLSFVVLAKMTRDENVR